MCIIICKPKGVELTNELLSIFLSAGNSNRDGIGISIKRKDESFIELVKGVYKPESFVKYIKQQEIQKEDEVMFHARIRTFGDVCDTNCHPFIIHNDDRIIDTINSDRLELPVLAHNGSFSEFCISGSKKSDTYEFVKSFASFPKFISSIEDIANQEKSSSNIFKMIFGYNKIAIMHPERDTPITLIGGFIDDLNGCLFSNSSYKYYVKKQ